MLTDRRRNWETPFDQSTVLGATLDDLDVDTATRARNNQSVPEQLASLLLASVDAVPTVASILLVGREPATWIRGAYLEFVRFAGRDATDPVTVRREFAGPLPVTVRALDDLMRAHIRMATQFAGVDREVNRPDYPLDALQQLTRNALTHRDYESSNAPVQVFWFDDRIEIHNPGGLFGRVTPARFGQLGGDDYRNPTLAIGLHALGYIERLGVGIPLARRACRANGNPEPEFLFQSNWFAAIVRSTTPGLTCHRPRKKRNPTTPV